MTGAVAGAVTPAAASGGLCIVLGNGPSLKGFDFARLDGVASLGMNAAYRYWDQIGWYPTYYACLDDQLIQTHHQRIYDMWREGRIRHFFLQGDFFALHPDCVGAPGMLSLDQVIPYLFELRGRGQGWDPVDHPAFRTADQNKITTGAYALRFAAWLGHDRLGVAGVDLRYVEILPEAERTEGVGLKMRATPTSNPNYFFDDYQRAGDTYNIPNPDQHDNRLHIDSFRVLMQDFAANGVPARLVNTNPDSMLEQEKVMPLWPMERLLAPAGLAAVAVPTNRHEIGAILDNFRLWADPGHAPWRSPPPPEARPVLCFVFNNDTDSDRHEPRLRAAFQAAGMERFFSGPEIRYLDLRGERDRYERDYSRDPGAEGFKAGPNNQFFGLIEQVAEFGLHVFQMETDCAPLRAGWLEDLDAAVRAAGPFWILGSRYHGEHPLEPAYRRHLNGNAVYAAGDDGFRAFVRDWQGWTRRLVAEVDPRLAYDCVIEKLFNEHGDQPDVAGMRMRSQEMLRETPLILNISGQRDLKAAEAPDYLSEVLGRFPRAAILHNRTVQRQLAERSRTRGLPRLLVVDMTRMGGGTATGELKAALLADWPSERLLQISAPGPQTLALVRRTGPGSHDEHPAQEAAIRAAVAEFEPELVLYRPLADRPGLHALAMDLIAELDVPLVTWIMDDWPARLEAEEPARFAELDRDLRRLLDRSALRLSISDAMSAAFETRYGHPFEAFANGIDPARWPARPPHRPGPVLLRYAGGLAPDMNAQSVLRVAQAVEDLARSGHEIRFEINTQPWWLTQSGALFEGLTATRVEAERRDFEAYARWLQEADALLVAYNFDPGSLRYIRYSMGNKLPECLASGAALLVHGPRGAATVDYAAATGAAELADTPDPDRLRAALEALLDPGRRQSLGEAGRRLALDRHDLTALAARLAERLQAAASLGQGPEFRFVDGASASAPGAAAARLADGGTGALVYDDPAPLLAAAAGRGNAAEVLADWLARTEPCLALWRRHRNALRVVARGDLAARPQAYAEGPAAPALAGVAPARPPRASDPVALALADTLLRRHPQAGPVLAELRAATWRPGPDRPAPGAGPEAALAALRVYDELRQQARATPSERRAAAGLRADLEERAKAAETQEAALALQQEQIAQLRAHLETYYAEADSLRTALEGERRARQAAQAELDHVYRSKSWRVTEPVRGIRRIFGPRNSEASQ